MRGERLRIEPLRLGGGDRLGLGRGIERGAILRARVIALPHALRRIMRFPEQGQQLAEGDFRGVVDHLDHFRVAGHAGADFLIGRIGGSAAGIADGGDVNAISRLPELALGAPETAHAEDHALHALGVGRGQRAAIDEMGLGGGQFFRATRQGLGGGGNLQLLSYRKHGEPPGSGLIWGRVAEMARFYSRLFAL